MEKIQGRFGGAPKEGGVGEENCGGALDEDGGFALVCVLTDDVEQFTDEC